MGDAPLPLPPRYLECYSKRGSLTPFFLANRNSTTGLTTITGALESTPSTNYVIEVFLTEDPSDTSGHGEGFRFLGSVVIRDPDGDGKLPFIIPDIEGLERGQQVSATATKLDTSTSPATPTDTSEFAQNHAVT